MQELWEEIWQTIRRNKWRSLMTAFGVFWGLLMLILLVGFGNGIFSGITGSLKTIPSNSMIMWGGSTSIAYKGFGIDRYVGLENNDQEAIEVNMSDKVRFLTPVNQAGSWNCSVGERTYTGSIVGTTPSYNQVVAAEILYGRYLNEVDLHERRKVCVIGREVYESLFTFGTDPSGELIKVGEVYYTVVGVVKRLSSMINIGSNPDRTLFLPITTEQLAYHQGNSIHTLVVTLKDDYPIDDYAEQLKGIIKEKHMVHPDDKTAIGGFSFAEVMQMFGNLFTGITALLWIVGCGSLLAGLIGISNIMLVTVKERTQEIGIRRALGAKPMTILSQILAESLVLTSAAGLAGLMAGIWILRIANVIIEASQAANTSSNAFPMQDAQIDFSVAIAATIVIIVGGLLAGWMPAKRAMKIKAIEALREE